MFNILIADDERIERIILNKVLKNYYGDSCTVFEVENGRLAIEAASKDEIQVIVMDISMPGIDGIEAARQIKLLKPSISIIFLTAHDEFSYAQKAVTVRAVDYILKPCRDEEILNAVDEGLRIYEREVELNKLEKRNETIEDDIMDLEELLSTQDKNSAILKEILDYVHEYYYKDISMQDVARKVNYSEAYFCKMFKRNFNMNFTTYLTNFRVKQAQKLLKDPKINIKDVGSAVGYSDSNYFAKVFKRVTGQNPSEYRCENTNCTV